MKGENSCKVSAEAKLVWIMPNRRRICGIAKQWRTKMVKVNDGLVKGQRLIAGVDLLFV